MTIQIDQAHATAAFWSGLAGGTTVQLIGPWAGFHRAINMDWTANPILIDASQATVTDFYPTRMKGVIVTAGNFAPSGPGKIGLRFDQCAGIEIRPGVTFIGSGPNNGDALLLCDCSHILVDGVKVRGVHFALNFTRCSFGEVRNCDIAGQGADAMDFFNCQDFFVHHNTIGQNAHDPLDQTHPDGIQIVSPKTGKRSERLRFEDNTINSTAQQGAYMGNYSEDGDTGSDGLVFRRNRIKVDTLRGLSICEAMRASYKKMTDPKTGAITWIDPATGKTMTAAPHFNLVMEDNIVETQPNAPYQSDLLYTNAPGVIDKGNYVGGFTGPKGRVFAGRSMSPVVAPPAPVQDNAALKAWFASAPLMTDPALIAAVGAASALVP